MPEGYFDIKRDNEIIAAGGFFCQACVVGKPASEQSPDPRYCQGCYDFLLKEAGLLPPTKCPKWIPKPQKAVEKAIPVPTGRGIKYGDFGERKKYSCRNSPAGPVNCCRKKRTKAQNFAGGADNAVGRGRRGQQKNSV